MSLELAVIDTINRFCLSLDRRDWQAARSCLADTLQVDPDGSAIGEGTPPVPAEQFLSMIRANVESFARTQHLTAGHHVRLDSPTTARCEASFQYSHVNGNDRWVLAGRQEARLRRAEAGWQLTAITLDPAWEEGTRPGPHPPGGPQAAGRPLTGDSQ